MGQSFLPGPRWHSSPGRGLIGPSAPRRLPTTSLRTMYGGASFGCGQPHVPASSAARHAGAVCGEHSPPSRLAASRAALGAQRAPDGNGRPPRVGQRTPRSRTAASPCSRFPSGLRDSLHHPILRPTFSRSGCPSARTYLGCGVPLARSTLPRRRSVRAPGPYRVARRWRVPVHAVILPMHESLHSAGPCRTRAGSCSEPRRAHPRGRACSRSGVAPSELQPPSRAACARPGARP